MSLTLTLLDAQESSPGGIVHIWALVTFSGSYVSGGDALNLASLYGQVSAQGIELDSSALPTYISVISKTGGWGSSGGGYYEPVTFTPAVPPVALTPATCLLRAFQAGGTETSGSYASSGITKDRVILYGTFRKDQS